MRQMSLSTVEIVIGELGDVPAVGAVLENEIGGAVIVNELADVAGFRGRGGGRCLRGCNGHQRCRRWRRRPAREP